jgi:hypothetical protein
MTKKLLAPGGFDFGGTKLQNLADGTSATDAVNRGQLDLADPAQIRPADHGLAAWTFDPASMSTTGVALTAGVIHLARIRLPRAVTVTGMHLYLTNAGSGLTNCFAGLYDSAGTRRAVTANEATNWAGTGLRSPAFTASYAATAGLYWLAILIGGTPPSIARAAMGGGYVGMTTIGQSASDYRSATTGSSLTALPTSITPASLTAYSHMLWAAASA